MVSIIYWTQFHMKFPVIETHLQIWACYSHVVKHLHWPKEQRTDQTLAQGKFWKKTSSTSLRAKLEKHRMQTHHVTLRDGLSVLSCSMHRPTLTFCHSSYCEHAQKSFTVGWRSLPLTPPAPPRIQHKWQFIKYQSADQMSNPTV